MIPPGPPRVHRGIGIFTMIVNSQRVRNTLVVDRCSKIAKVVASLLNNNARGCFCRLLVMRGWWKNLLLELPQGSVQLTTKMLNHSGICLIVALVALSSWDRVQGFSISTPFYSISPFSSIQSPSPIYSRTSLQMNVQQPFNPFTARHRNSKVKWFEADLEAFYSFVEEQPLLTAEQELQYGKALKLSIQVEKLRNQLQMQEGSLEIIDNIELAAHMNTTTEFLDKMGRYAELSRTRLLNSNLKLVLAVVSRYRTSAIPNAELIAEGTRGLSRAVLRYDYSKGFRFATYATWYVHQAVAEYVRWRKHPAKMPSRYLILFRKVKQFSTDYKLEMNRLPTIREISLALNQPQFDIIKVLTMQQYPLLTCATVSSKDAYKSEGKEKTIEEILPSGHKIPSKQTDSKDLRRDMEKMMLLNLNDVERDVLRLRLGLDDGRVKPVKEVGKRFKISWKQVRNVEKEALSKLLSSEEIASFVDNYHSASV